jgi:hypothetical protein
MATREPDQSGDYEYDLAHEQTIQGRSAEAAASPHRQHPPTGRPVGLDSDMSYDESHDF